MAYDEDNIFAKILRGEIPAYKIYEDDETFAFLDVMPQTKGHALVISKSPSENLMTASATSLQSMILTVQKIATAGMEAFQADGITIQQFNHAAGGQTVFHTHFHILPRFDGLSLKPHTGGMEDADILQNLLDSYIKVLG